MILGWSNGVLLIIWVHGCTSFRFQVVEQAKPPIAASDRLDGMAAALAKALEERAKFIHSSGKGHVLHGHKLLNTDEISCWWWSVLNFFLDDSDEDDEDSMCGDDEWEDWLCTVFLLCHPIAHHRLTGLEILLIQLDSGEGDGEAVICKLSSD